MMDLEKICAVLASKQDQDMEDCKRWLSDTSDHDLVKMWLFLQQEFEIGNAIARSSKLEVMSRFAQLGFTEAMLSKYKTELDEPLAPDEVSAGDLAVLIVDQMMADGLIEDDDGPDNPAPNKCAAAQIVTDVLIEWKATRGSNK